MYAHAITIFTNLIMEGVDALVDLHIRSFERLYGYK
jgi:hypothetical protein